MGAILEFYPSPETEENTMLLSTLRHSLNSSELGTCYKELRKALWKSESFELKKVFGRLEAALIEEALIEHNLSPQAAANFLGLNRTTLCEKMVKYGINRKHYEQQEA